MDKEKISGLPGEAEQFDEKELIRRLGEVTPLAAIPVILELKENKPAVLKGKNGEVDEVVWIRQYDTALEKLLVSDLSEEDEERLGGNAQTKHQWVYPSELIISTD